MEALKIAAQFAAYTWYENTHANGVNPAEKARFANENWKRFMPIAHEGLGKLLLKIAAGRPSGRQKRRLHTQAKLAAAG